MNRTHVLIGALLAVIVLLAIGIAFLLGRQSTPPAPDNSVAAAPAAPAPPAKAPPPAPAPNEDATLGVWLAGGWAEEATNCETDTGQYYEAGGRYGGSGVEGRWRIENGELVVTVTHEAVGDPMAGEMRRLPDPRPERFRFTREGQNRMVQVIDGTPIRMMRCPQAQHSFSS